MCIGKPVWLSNDEFAVLEETTPLVADLAVDVEGQGTYAIVGGADAGDFVVDPSTGVLSFKNGAPDFEDPQDRGRDNRYHVDVRFTDFTGASVERTLTVIVEDKTDEVDPGTGRIGDQVFLDADGDGLKRNEDGVAGVSVTLTGAGADGEFGTADDITKTQTTNAKGKYSFRNLDGGDYKVTFEAPDGFEFTLKDVVQGSSEGFDSDVNPDTGMTDVITLAPGQRKQNVDAGLVPTGDPGPGNTDPDAVNDSRTTDLNTPVTINVLGNDSDPENDPLSITSVGTPSNGTAQVVNGQVVYTPNNGFTGTDTFSYSISDGNGGSDTAQVKVTVEDDTTPSDPGTAQIGDQVWLDANGDGIRQRGEAPVAGVQVTLTGAGADGVFGTGDDISQTKTTNSKGKYIFKNLDGGDYRISVDAPDGLSFTTQDAGSNDGKDSDVDANGVTDVISLAPGQRNKTVDAGLVQDGPSNTAPDAVNDRTSTPINTPVSINVLANDSDPEGDPLSIEQIVGDPVNGTAQIVNGQVLYTPDAGFVGNDTFAYQISDGNGGRDIAQVTVTIAPTPNTAPDAVNDNSSTGINTPVSINVLGNDSDPENDPLSVTSIEGQSVSPGDTVTTDNGTATLLNNGQISFTPNNGFIGTDRFTYHISDGNGGEDTATVRVNVAPAPNSAPNAVNDNSSTGVNTPVSINVLGNDSDPENDPLSVTSIEGQSVSPGDTVTTDNGTATLLNNGQVRFTPNAGFIGNELFDYHVSDGNGGEDTATVRVTVEGAPNGAPTANNDSSSTTINTPVSIDVVSNDTDPNGDTLSVTSLNGQAVTPGGSITTDNGRVQLLANGQLSFTPNDGFVGNDVFTYHVSDGNGGESTADVTVSVTSPPDAMDDSAVAKGGSVTIDVLANDSDPDGDPLSIKGVEDPDNGSVSIVDGQLVYTPDAGFTGADVFDYSISDGNGGHDTASVTVKSFVDLGGASNSARSQTSVAGGVVNQFTDTRIVVKTSQLNEALVRNDVKSILSIDNLNEINQAVSDFRGGTLERTPKQTPEGSKSIALNYSKRGTDLNQRAARAFEGELELTYMLNNGDVETGHFTFGFGDVGHRTVVAPGSPISFDLNGDGIQTLNIDDGVMFDLLNTGEAVNTGWLSGEDGFLAVDTDGDGLITSRAELFGGVVAGVGFAKLASFDSTGDGLVNEADAQFGELKLWQDANENGITDQGELVALSSTGITDLSTAYKNVFSTDAQGNIHGEVSSAVKNGSTIEMTDVYFQVSV